MNPKYKKYLKTSAFAIVAFVAIFLGYLFFGKEKETPIEVQTVKMSKGAITFCYRNRYSRTSRSSRSRYASFWFGR